MIPYLFLSGVKPSSVLVFSFIGYKTQEIPCSGRQEINVVLSEDAQALDEVVVVGYGSLSKKELSSSIVQVDRSKFLQGSMNNPMEMLTGKVAGLTVKQYGGSQSECKFLSSDSWCNIYFGIRGGGFLSRILPHSGRLG